MIDKQPSTKTPCCGCGGLFEHGDGPEHAYMLASPGCWEHYGKVLAKEFENPALFEASHRLTVDAYALQHPGLETDQRAVQSVRIHYVALHLIFEEGRTHEDARKALSKLAGSAFAPLPPPPIFGVTVRDISTTNLDSHNSDVEAWARHSFAAWSALSPYAQDLCATVLSRP